MEFIAMRVCRRCKSEGIHASRTRSRWEKWRKAITGKRPFRCRSCGWRGWGVDSGPIFAEADCEAAARAVAPEPPDLTATALRREERHSDLDVTALDTPSHSRTSEEEPQD
jgi:hypothetical protein